MLCIITKYVLSRRKQEEADLYQSLKEAKLVAKKLDEEKRRTHENERQRIEELRVSVMLEIN